MCDCSEECMGGSKFINFAFGTLTLIITIALLIQIHYGDYQVGFQKYLKLPNSLILFFNA